MKFAESRRSRFAFARVASALLAAALLGSCGRGPLTPPNITPTVGTITFQLYVSGAITPAQGDYIIAINAVTLNGTSVNPGEGQGMPTVAEAQAGSFTHWDQEFVYGFDTAVAPNGFNYSYKALGTGGVVNFVPIILTSNEFIFNPTLSVGSGVNNAMSITIPISFLSVRSNPNGTNPPTVTTPPAVKLHVNYITTDNSPQHVPQDQLGCCGLQTSGYDLIIDLTTAATYFNQLTTPPGKLLPPNPNLFITGGQIIVKP
jgi:hypothetical protein